MSKNIKRTLQNLHFDEISTNWSSFDAETDQQCIFEVDQNMPMRQQLHGLGTLDSKTKKRQKKKQYKRRRRDRQKLHEKQASIELEEIIQHIYRLQTKFEPNKNKIQICLSYFDCGDKFNDFLAQAIKVHIQSVQQELLNSTHQLIVMNLEQDNNIETLEFYCEIASNLYRQYECIQEATQEIKKIIRLYKNMHDICDNEMVQYKDLDKSTFSYLINSDDSIKHQVRLCQRKIIDSKKQKLPLQVRQFLILLQILEIDLSVSDSDCLNQNSTSIDQEEQITESKASKKKNKKKKIKQSDLISDYENIMNGLQNLIIKDDRNPCNVSQQWINTLDTNCFHMFTY